jgi:WD40 repeat protein
MWLDPMSLKDGRSRAVTCLLALLAFFAALVAHTPARSEDSQAAHLQIELGDHAGAVRRIAVAEKRDLLVTGADDKSTRSWSLASGRPLRVFRTPVGENEIGRVYGVAVHPTQPWIAIGGTSGNANTGRHAIYIFDAVSGQPLRWIDARGGDIKRLCWSADGTLLIAAYAGAHGIRAFDTNGAMIFEERFDAAVYALTTSPQGLLGAVAFDGALRIYEAAGGSIQRRASLTAPARNAVAASFSPDGKSLVVGYFAQGKAPDIVDWQTGATRALPAPLRMKNENLMSVAWSARTGRVFAAGTFGFSQRKVALVEYDPGRGSIVREQTVARFSIADLAALEDGRIAFAATDGSWGVTGEAARTSRLPDLTGAANLRVAVDGQRLSWTLDGGSARVLFDLGRREVRFGEGGDLPRASLRRGMFDAVADWENLSHPLVNGARITLQPDEVSRAAALFEKGADAVLGTSRALYRLDDRGRVVWRVSTATEVRAVNVTRDDRVIVTAMLDGTVRLWRSADGQELLALLVLHDGRWVMWTPAGYFDAAVGADALVGWLINRPADGAADYYPLARLRERFHQPRLIDGVLESLDHAAAIRMQREAIEREATAPDNLALASMPAPVAPRAEQLPPVLSSPTPSGLPPDSSVVKIPFAVSTQSPVARLQFEARVDGRPVTTQVVAPPSADGKSLGWATVDLPPQGTSLQLLASDGNGFSEALSFQREQPAVSAAPRPIEEKAAKPTVPVEKSPAAARMPRLFLVAIGVSEYARAEYSLGLAAKDARDFAAAMAAQQGKFYGEVVTRVLVDGQAKRDAVLAAFHWLSTAPARNDVAILFMAGHGLNATSGKYFFLPHDGREEELRTTAIAEDEIRNALRAVAGRAVLFVDTCFAGKAIGTLKDRNRELSRFVNDLASAENGVVVFAASAGRQLSEESDAWGNGAFTRALLEGLSGKADLLKSGRITYKGLDYFVSEEVKRLTKGRQTPVSLSPWGVPDFALAAIGG